MIEELPKFPCLQALLLCIERLLKQGVQLVSRLNQIISYRSASSFWLSAETNMSAPPAPAPKQTQNGLTARLGNNLTQPLFVCSGKGHLLPKQPSDQSQPFFLASFKMFQDHMPLVQNFLYSRGTVQGLHVRHLGSRQNSRVQVQLRRVRGTIQGLRIQLRRLVGLIACWPC